MTMLVELVPIVLWLIAGGITLGLGIYIFVDSIRSRTFDLLTVFTIVVELTLAVISFGVLLTLLGGH